MLIYLVWIIMFNSWYKHGMAKTRFKNLEFSLWITLILNLISPSIWVGPVWQHFLSLPLHVFLSDGWVSVRPSTRRSMSITSVQVFLRGHDLLWDWVSGLSSIIATFYMAVRPQSAGAECLCQIVKLHPLQEILWADLVLGASSESHATGVFTRLMKHIETRPSYQDLGFAHVDPKSLSFHVGLPEDQLRL